MIGPLNAFKISFFNLVVDKAKQSLEDRFEQLKNHDNLFGFLGRFQTSNKKELKKHAEDLEIALTDSKIIQMDTSNDTVKPDLEGIILLEEVEALKSILSSEYFQNRLKCFKFYLKMIELRHFQTYLLLFAYI